MTDTNHLQSTFALKITGIDLNNINPMDIGKLLQEFCQLLGEENLHFNGIYQGSAVFKVCADNKFYTQKLEKLHQNIQKSSPKTANINKIIRNYSAYFPDIQAKILAHPTAYNDYELTVIHEFNVQEKIKRQFEQNETFVGKLIKPAHGKDNTDHFTIELANKQTVSVELAKSLSFELATHLESLWRFESLVQFTGQARYEKQGYELKLRSFKANGFEIIDNQHHGKDWVNTFVAFGQSGWQSLDNPLHVWQRERHL